MAAQKASRSLFTKTDLNIHPETWQNKPSLSGLLRIYVMKKLYE